MRQTFFAKQNEIQRGWRIVDADGKRLGRLAVEIATVLMGKHRPEYTPHIDVGDFVIVTNAEKITMTGNKASQRHKYRYSGHPGGLRGTSYGDLIRSKPEFVIEDAVSRMLPKGRLGRAMIKKLKVYRGTKHPHQAQQPIALDA
ncbi:MAG TPA: 50S ribosomal protein L13 [Phycisphaerales bacterium]|nr:50S ribosomal protein L13 [Phycisphaerales bacterium]